MIPIVHKSSAHTRRRDECRSVCTSCRRRCVCCVSWPLPPRDASLNCSASPASLGDCRLLKNPLSCLPSAALCGSKHAQKQTGGVAGESVLLQGAPQKPQSHVEYLEERRSRTRRASGVYSSRGWVRIAKHKLVIKSSKPKEGSRILLHICRDR